MPVIVNEMTVDVEPPPPRPEATRPRSDDEPSYCERLVAASVAWQRRQRLTFD